MKMENPNLSSDSSYFLDLSTTAKTLKLSYDDRSSCNIFTQKGFSLHKPVRFH